MIWLFLVERILFGTEGWERTKKEPTRKKVFSSWKEISVLVFRDQQEDLGLLYVAKMKCAWALLWKNHCPIFPNREVVHAYSSSTISLRKERQSIELCWPNFFSLDFSCFLSSLAGKSRRLTFIECNNDLNSMIDIGKIADLVLLMIDGSFGFEMVRILFHLAGCQREKRNSDRLIWSHISLLFVLPLFDSLFSCSLLRKLWNSSTFYNLTDSQKWWEFWHI